MSVARHVYLRRVLFGRRFSAALTLLAGLRMMQLLGMSERDFQSAGGVLPICFALTSAMTFLVFVATPLFLLGLSDIPAMLASHLRAIRAGSRRASFMRLVPVVALRAAVFAFFTVMSGLAIVALRSGCAFSVAGYTLFALMETVPMAVMLLTCGLLLLAAYLATCSLPGAACCALVYDAVDYAIDRTYLADTPAMWFGWKLALFTYPVDLALELGKLVRLMAIALVFLALAAGAARRFDYQAADGGS